jgi:WXG100 family type VII secretion target
VTGFEAVPVELQVCGSMVTEIGDELRTELNTLRMEMDALFNTGWQGRAANGFAQGWEQWQAGAQEVRTALREMADLLTTTGRNYGVTDQSASDQVRDSGAGL